MNGKTSILTFLTIAITCMLAEGALAVNVWFQTRDVTFVPNQELSLAYVAENKNDEAMGISISVIGDLAEHISVSPSEFRLGPHETKEFDVVIRFPEKIEKPGVHEQLIRVKENRDAQQGTIVVFGQVNQPLRIHVPYSGKYLDAYLSTEGAKQGEDVTFKVSMSNLGDQPINRISGTVYAYNGANDSIGKTEISEVYNLEPNGNKDTEAILNAKELSPGRYWAYAELNYDGLSAHTPAIEFRIGELKVDLGEYSKSGFTGKINPFFVEVESNWNEQIRDVIAEVTLKNGTSKMAQFRTLSESLGRWERKNLTGYIDLSSVPTGNYTLELILRYADRTESSAGIYEVIPEPKLKKSGLEGWQVIALIVIAVLIINIGIWILISRREKRE